MGKLLNLQFLFLHQNLISVIPNDFVNLTQLKLLTLSENPITNLNKAIVDSDNVAKILGSLVKQ